MSTSSRLRASVACYHCGHRSGEVETPDRASLTEAVFLPASNAELRVPLRGRQVRCSRCGGPTYLDEIRTIVIREPRVITWRGRGRPPKDAIRIELPAPEGVKRRRPIVMYAVVDTG